MVRRGVALSLLSVPWIAPGEVIGGALAVLFWRRNEERGVERWYLATKEESMAMTLRRAEH